MFSVFISYRHEDTPHVTPRIFERIQKQFRRGVFCDVGHMDLGEDFRHSLRAAANDCAVMVAVIGPDWFGASPDGRRRIDEPEDWVRREVGIGLERNIPVIPVLVHPARMPAVADLPAPLQELAFRQAITVYDDRQFDSSVLILIDQLVGLRERQMRSVSRLATKAGRLTRVLRKPVAMVAMLLIAVAAVAGTWAYLHYANRDTRRVDPTVVNTWEGADRTKLQKEIDGLLARHPQPQRERLPGWTGQAQLGSPDYANFDILSDERTWDLRGWKPLPAECLVVMTRTIRVVKAAAADEIRFEARTDGDDVFLQSTSHPGRCRELVQTQLGFVGARPTKVRQLAIDVSDVPVGEEFFVKLLLTYRGSLQNPADRWLGGVGYPRSDRIRMIVLMPDERPYKSYRLQLATSTRDTPTAYAGPVRVLEGPDRKSLMWEVPSPLAGHVYSVLLEW